MTKLIYRYALFTIIIISGIYASYTDIKHKKIYNNMIFFLLIIGLFIQFFYNIHTIDIKKFIDWILSLIFILFIVFIMYHYDIWAAGDAKLFIAIILLYPIEEDLKVLSIGCSSLVLIFSLAFLYLVVESCYIYIKNKREGFSPYISVPSEENIKERIVRYILIYIYICLINDIIISIYPHLSNYVVFGLSIICIYVFEKLWDKLNRIYIIFIIIGLILLEIKFGSKSFLQLNSLFNFAIVFGIMALRNFSSKYTYKNIKVDDLKPGMILSYSTVIGFSKSRVKGLPEFTTENTKTRLTESQVESIQRWKHSKYGSDEVVIVRFIPFAPFIFIGNLLNIYLIYFR